MSENLPLQSPPDKICILRLSAIGDVTHAIPVVRAIQSSWPDVEITWICGKLEYKLLQLIEGVHFIVFDKSRGIRSYLDLWKALEADHFDVLLHMQTAARANIASLRIKADIKLGWDKARSRDFHQLFVNHTVPDVKQQHQVQGFLSFARSLGIDAQEPGWNIPLTNEALSFVSNHIKSDQPLLVISACSSHEMRNWKAERYAQIADYAINEFNMQVVLSGGPSQLELDMASQIESYMHYAATNLVGKDTLQQLCGLLSKASVVVSPDSGPAHLANALGVPVIGLYACTWSRRSGPYGSLEYCVDKFDEAADMFLHKSADSLPWGTRIERPGVMDLISVDDVIDKLKLVMGK